MRLIEYCNVLYVEMIDTEIDERRSVFMQLETLDASRSEFYPQSPIVFVQVSSALASSLPD